MKLYGFPASPNTWKVRALAAYLKMPLDFEFVDLTKGAQYAPAYLALNPTGRTPTLSRRRFHAVGIGCDLAISCVEGRDAALSERCEEPR